MLRSRFALPRMLLARFQVLVLLAFGLGLAGLRLPVGVPVIPVSSPGPVSARSFSMAPSSPPYVPVRFSVSCWSLSDRLASCGR